MLLAILQGLFEWWPISSSGVLVLVSTLYGLNISTGYTSGLALHLASGLAVLTIYRGQVYSVLREVTSLKIRETTKHYLYALIVSFVVGGPLYITYIGISEYIGSFALILISIGLIVTSLFLLRGRGGLSEDISLYDWLITGLLQGIAVLPGFSRSGLTIGYLCIRGYKPEKAVEASLLLAIPALLVAGTYNLLKTSSDITTIAVAQAIVYLISILSARVLIEFSRRTRFYIFTLTLAILTMISALIQILF